MDMVKRSPNIIIVKVFELDILALDGGEGPAI